MLRRKRNAEETFGNSGIEKIMLDYYDIYVRKLARYLLIMQKMPSRKADITYKFLYYFVQLKDIAGFKEALSEALTGDQKDILDELELFHDLVKVDEKNESQRHDLRATEFADD